MDQLVARGNVTELNSEIATAEELANSSVVGTENGQYPQEAKDILLASINTAKELSSSDDVTQVGVDEALAKLKEAIETFKSKVVVEDTNNGSNSTNKPSNDGSNSTNKPNSNVNTGDISNGYIYGILALAAAGLVALNIKKKKEAVK